MIRLAIYLASLVVAVTSFLSVFSDGANLLGMDLSRMSFALLSIAASVTSAFTCPLMDDDDERPRFAAKSLSAISIPLLVAQGLVGAFGTFLIAPLMLIAYVSSGDMAYLIGAAAGIAFFAPFAMMKLQLG